MNIITLQQQIKTFLETIANRVYFQKAPDNAIFPYVVYNLPDSFELEAREDFRLEIDVWDDEQDTTVLDTLVGNIDGDGDIESPTGLHRKLIYSGGFSAKFYRTNRYILDEDNTNLNRRQLRYNVQVYLT